MFGIGDQLFGNVHLFTIFVVADPLKTICSLIA